MRRPALAATLSFSLVALLAPAGTALAQLVPLTRCQAAFPCSVPYGLRPADAVTNLPDARLGNSLIGAGVGLDNGLKVRVAVSPVSEDPSEGAARLFLRKNPLKPKATPTPGPTPAAAPSAPPNP